MRGDKPHCIWHLYLSTLHFRLTTMNEKMVIVTGGNRGIGFATVRALAQRGARVIMAVRDVGKGEASAAVIRAEVKDAAIEVMALDLADLASVRRFAEAYIAKGYPLHALINNAGIIGAGKQIHFTKDGFESEFGINHIGHFLLAMLLLPVLKKSAQEHAPARVIAVSSIRHMSGKGGVGAKFDFDNLKGEKFYEPRLFYNNTKLANVWFAYELQRRLAGSGVISMAACPGFVPETFGMTKGKWWGKIYTKALMLIPAARTADVSGEELADLALSPAFANGGGQFFADGKAMRSSDDSYDEAKAGRLWELSEQWVGMR